MESNGVNLIPIISIVDVVKSYNVIDNIRKNNIIISAKVNRKIIYGSLIFIKDLICVNDPSITLKVKAWCGGTYLDSIKLIPNKENIISFYIDTSDKDDSSINYIQLNVILFEKGIEKEINHSSIDIDKYINDQYLNQLRKTRQRRRQQKLSLPKQRRRQHRQLKPSKERQQHQQQYERETNGEEDYEIISLASEDVSEFMNKSEEKSPLENVHIRIIDLEDRENDIENKIENMKNIRKNLLKLYNDFHKFIIKKDEELSIKHEELLKLEKKISKKRQKLEDETSITVAKLDYREEMLFRKELELKKSKQELEKNGLDLLCDVVINKN